MLVHRAPTGNIAGVHAWGPGSAATPRGGRPAPAAAALAGPVAAPPDGAGGGLGGAGGLCAVEAASSPLGAAGGRRAGPVVCGTGCTALRSPTTARTTGTRRSRPSLGWL